MDDLPGPKKFFKKLKFPLDKCFPVCYNEYIKRKERTTMTNTALYMNMIDRYNRLAYTHNYIFGFEYKHNIYMAYATADMMPYVCVLDRASRGAGSALRFKPTTEQKLLLMQKSEILCSAEYFKSEVDNSIYIAGEIFEKMVTEYFGQVWEKDNIPFTKAGDIKVGRISYQIKFQKATFISEKSLARFERI